MKSTICVPLLLLLGLVTAALSAETTADWHSSSSQKGRRQGTLVERIVEDNELPTDRPSSTVVMFTGDLSLLERIQRAQARRRGWTTSLSDPAGLQASTTRHGTVAAVTNGRTFDPNESRRDLDGTLFDQVCA